MSWDINDSCSQIEGTIPSKYLDLLSFELDLNVFVVDYALLFAQLIARTAKDIDYLIDHLPNEESSMELQVCDIILYFISCYILSAPLGIVIPFRRRFSLEVIFCYFADGDNC